MKSQKEYWEEHYKNTEIHVNPNLEIFKSFYEKYKEKLESPAIDLGCGSGEILDFLEGKNFEEIYGVDMSKTALSIANEKTSDTKFFRKNIYDEDLPFKENYFMLMISSMSLHHKNHQSSKRSLERWTRYLEKGGIFYLLTRSKSSLLGNEKKTGKSTYYIPYIDQERVHFNKESLESIIPPWLENMEFKEIYFRGKKNSLITSWQAIFKKK